MTKEESQDILELTRKLVDVLKGKENHAIMYSITIILAHVLKDIPKKSREIIKNRVFEKTEELINDVLIKDKMVH